VAVPYGAKTVWPIPGPTAVNVSTIAAGSSAKDGMGAIVGAVNTPGGATRTNEMLITGEVAVAVNSDAGAITSAVPETAGATDCAVKAAAGAATVIEMVGAGAENTLLVATIETSSMFPIDEPATGVICMYGLIFVVTGFVILIAFEMKTHDPITEVPPTPVVVMYP